MVYTFYRLSICTNCVCTLEYEARQYFLKYLDEGSPDGFATVLSAQVNGVQVYCWHTQAPYLALSPGRCAESGEGNPSGGAALRRDFKAGAERPVRCNTALPLSQQLWLLPPCVSLVVQK